MAGSLFALAVYLSDGYLRIPEGFKPEKEKEVKFFVLISRLPLDLQMVLCNRVFDLGHSIIKRNHSEKGFIKFATKF